MRNRVQTLRIDKRMTQEELAKKLKVTRTYLSALENNKYTPSLKTAVKLAKALDVTVEELIESEEK